MRRANSYRPPDRSSTGRARPVEVDTQLDADEGGLASHADLPVFAYDAISLSGRARRLVERIKPIVIRVLSFWDHRVTRLTIGDRTLVVDGSGSYRVE